MDVGERRKHSCEYGPFMEMYTWVSSSSAYLIISLYIKRSLSWLCLWSVQLIVLDFHKSTLHPSIRNKDPFNQVKMVTQQRWRYHINLTSYDWLGSLLVCIMWPWTSLASESPTRKAELCTHTHTHTDTHTMAHLSPVLSCRSPVGYLIHELYHGLPAVCKADWLHLEKGASSETWCLKEQSHITCWQIDGTESESHEVNHPLQYLSQFLSWGIPGEFTWELITRFLPTNHPALNPLMLHH